MLVVAGGDSVVAMAIGIYGVVNRQYAFQCVLGPSFLCDVGRSFGEMIARGGLTDRSIRCHRWRCHRHMCGGKLWPLWWRVVVVVVESGGLI